MDVTDIEQLIALMRRAGVVHLSLEQPSYKISITRGAEAQAEAPAAAAVPASPAAPMPAAAGPPAAIPAPASAVPVGSPVVGQARFVGGQPPRVGERVRRGQLLAVVEAMKVPNEVRSPVEGTVTSVLVEDGRPVEYGQTLFLVLPDEGGGADEDETPVGVA